MSEERPGGGGIPTVQKLVSVLWPSFLTAGVATILFFTAFDPYDLGMALGIEELDRLEAYSIGFFAFWILTASSCALTCYFQRPCDQVNRPPDR